MHEAVAPAARRLTLNLAEFDVGLTKVEKLEKLQGQFESLEEDLLVSRIAEKSLPADFPSDQAVEIISEFSKIQVDSGPFYLTVFSKNLETDTWRIHSKNAKIRDTFLLYAETAARLAGYQGDSPATHWLDRIYPEGQADGSSLDLREASADECQRLINEVRNGSDEVEEESALPLVAQNIKRLREECCLTQEQLADKVGVDKRRIQEHESGKKTPRLQSCKDYAQAFSKELDRKLSGHELRTLNLKAR